MTCNTERIKRTQILEHATENIQKQKLDNTCIGLHQQDTKYTLKLWFKAQRGMTLFKRHKNETVNGYIYTVEEAQFVEL